MKKLSFPQNREGICKNLHIHNFRSKKYYTAEPKKSSRYHIFTFSKNFRVFIDTSRDKIPREHEKITFSMFSLSFYATKFLQFSKNHSQDGTEKISYPPINLL